MVEKMIYVKMVGHEAFTLFPNKKKIPGDKLPDFICNGVGAWVRTKKEKPKEESESVL